MLGTDPFMVILAARSGVVIRLAEITKATPVRPMRPKYPSEKGCINPELAQN